MSKNHSHGEALDALCGCAATVTVLSYEEAIKGYFSLRGWPDPETLSTIDTGRAREEGFSAGIEAAAKVAHDYKDKIREPHDWFIAVDIAWLIRAVKETGDV